MEGIGEVGKRMRVVVNSMLEVEVLMVGICEEGRRMRVVVNSWSRLICDVEDY